MKNSKLYEQNQKLLIQAFNSQNNELYDEAYEKLEMVGHNLIARIEAIEKNAQFYMRVMPILKQQRQLVSQKDYNEFLHKNERVLCKNFQQNAYFALLMQEMEQKTRKQAKKWTNNDELMLYKMVIDSYSYEEIQEKFNEHDNKELRRKYQKIVKKLSSNPELGGGNSITNGKGKQPENR